MIKEIEADEKEGKRCVRVWNEKSIDYPKNMDLFLPTTSKTANLIGKDKFFSSEMIEGNSQKLRKLLGRYEVWKEEVALYFEKLNMLLTYFIWLPLLCSCRQI